MATRFISASYLIYAFLPLLVNTTQAQTHKGISFQGVIKLPSGEHPTRTGVAVKTTILSPNNCILREEEFSNVSILNGYLNLALGTGAITGNDPGLNLKQVMQNVSPITQGPNKPAGLVCLDNSNNIDTNNNSYNPSSGDGRRKLRLSLRLDSLPIVADFNIRSTAYAINAETADDAKTLNGKSDSAFIQNSTTLNGDLSGNLPNPTVKRLNGVDISKASASDNGKFLKYNSDNSGSWTPQFLKISDLKNSAGSLAAFNFTPCLANQALTWSSTTDQITCQNIDYSNLSNKPSLGSLASKSSVDLSTSEASGILAPSRFPALTGDITTVAGSLNTTISTNAVSTNTIADAAVTDAKINTVSASKITGTISSTNLPMASETTDGIVNQIAQSFKGVKTFINDIMIQGSLSVSGYISADRIKLANSSATCNASIEGSVRYNNTLKMMEFCNGTSWFGLTISDPCIMGNPNIGTQCLSGTIYLGQFDGGRYMTTPGGCTDSATPTCTGGTDATSKPWNDGTSTFTLVSGVETFTSEIQKSSSSFRGNTNTAAIIAHHGAAANAAKYCDDMVYGGYNDWYLPSKSELAYMYCKASTPYHNSNYPEESPDCSVYGGKQSLIPGFALNYRYYWSSTQYGQFGAWTQQFRDGEQDTGGKNNYDLVRCVRRY